MMNLNEEFERVCKVPSDINEHCALLSSLAASYSTITEFGVRYGVSTIAFLAGRPERLTSYDLVCQIDVAAFQEMAPDTEFTFVKASSLDVDLSDVGTDILFIDILHTATQLYAELDKHHRYVDHHIVLHDTTTFGNTGEDGQPGLNFAISKFLAKHKEWRVSNYIAKNNGLSILSRQGHPQL